MKINRSSKLFIKKQFSKELRIFSFFAAVLILIGVFFCVYTASLSAQKTVLQAVGVVAVILGIVGFIWAVASSVKRRKDVLNYLEKFSFGTENTAKAALLSFPNPMVVVTKTGIIQWCNPEFMKISRREDLFGVSLQEIFPAVRLSSFLGDKKEEQEFSYNGKDFVVTGDVWKSGDENDDTVLISICFNNISELVKLSNQLEEQKVVVCTAIIDNYDEVLRETPNSNHGVLLSDIERSVDTWVEKGNGIYRRYERDKFVMLFESAKFDILLNEKFTILNDVKEINQQNKIPVTLSIGVGTIGDDLQENNKLSLAALDMALGRGGDQAVIKTENGYVFYGAKSLGVEKSTKVKARVVAKSLCNLIDKATNVIIMGHKGADYDSFGAAVGLFRAVMDRDKKPYIAMDKEHNNVGDLLSDIMIQTEYAEGVISHERALALANDGTLLIVVDTHRPSMTEYPELINRVSKIVLIDHHRRSEEFIENALLTFHEPYASSTCEMVAENIAVYW